MKDRQRQRKEERGNKRAKVLAGKKKKSSVLKKKSLLIKRIRKRLLDKVWQKEGSMLLEQSDRGDNHKSIFRTAMRIWNVKGWKTEEGQGGKEKVAGYTGEITRGYEY